MTKSGGEATFPASIRVGAGRGSRWKDEGFVDSSRHLATPDGPSASQQRGFPGVTAGELFISVCRGPACHGDRPRGRCALSSDR